MKPATKQPPPKQAAAPQQSMLERIRQHLGPETTASEIQLIDPTKMADVTAMLDDALKRKAGHPFFNPRHTRVADLELHYFRAKLRYFGGDTGLQCFIRHRASGKEIYSNVELWPRNDFWAVLVELSQLA